MIRAIVGGILAHATPPVVRFFTLAKASRLETMLLAALGHFTYFGLIGALLIAGMGVPIPEDIPLILSGWACSPDHSFILTVDSDGNKVGDVPNLYIMMVAGMIGVLAGDSIIFTIGRRGIDSNNFVARHIRKVMHSKRREKVERHFAKHGNLTVFAGRFMPGFRSIVFAFAGMSKMSYLRFLLIDGIAALISVPFFVFIGYHFAEHIESAKRFKHILLPIVGAIIVGAIVIYFLRRRRARVAGVEG